MKTSSSKFATAIRLDDLTFVVNFTHQSTLIFEIELLVATHNVTCRSTRDVCSYVLETIEFPGK
jgi:hypothetical protein